MASNLLGPRQIGAKVQVRTGKTLRRAFDLARPLESRVGPQTCGPSDSFPQIFRFVRAGTAMASHSSKYRRFEEEYLIPVGFGWTVMVIALYIAVVVLQ